MSEPGVSPPSMVTPTPPPTRVRLVLERHLGLRTYADNLLAVARGRDGVVIDHVPIVYARRELGWLPQRLENVRGALVGRKEVRAGTRRSLADVDVYNTQVPAALAGRALRRPYVVVSDVTPVQYDRMAPGYDHRPDRFPPLRRWKQRVNERVFRGAATCVGWSTWVVQSFVDDYGVSRSCTEVIPPGVDLDRWRTDGELRRADDRIDLLFVGGDLDRKGGRMLIELLPVLPESVHLTLVTRTKLGSSDRVTVVNDLEPNDLRLVGLFHRADVFVLPTLAETFGIAAVEASAAGLPVVASDVGGLRDIVEDGVTGFLTKPGDAAGLRIALERVIADSDTRRAFGSAARERAADRFDATRNANRLLDVAIAAAAQGGRDRRTLPSSRSRRAE